VSDPAIVRRCSGTSGSPEDVEEFGGKPGVVWAKIAP